MAVKNATSSATLTADNYRFLQEHIYRGSGIVIGADKHYLIEARLTPIAQQESLQSLNDLCTLIRMTSGTRLRQHVIDAMTTNETFFFREMELFEVLRKEVMPALLKSRIGRRLRIWSAAASSGQEAYSIAMICREMGLDATAVEIIGTDLSTQVLAKAKTGVYTQFEINRGLPAIYLIKYFNKVDGQWEITDEVRRMVRFDCFDLRQPMNMLGQMDIVLCRNVLIYFDEGTRKTVLEGIARLLCKDGFLFLGTTESASVLSNFFNRMPFGKIIGYQAAGNQ